MRVGRRSSVLQMGETLTRNLALVLQVLAGLGMMGLYYRVMSDLNLPFVFLLLPLALLMLPITTRFTTLLEDLSTRDTVTGVLTGVTCSFPVVVTNTQQIQVFSLSPWTERYLPPKAALIRSCELLFLPLLLATILLSFAKTIERFPSSVGLATAAATAFSADFTIMTCYVMLRADDTRGSDVISTLLLLLIPFFLLCLLPLVRDKQRAWILSLVCIVALIFWEVIFSGSTLCIWSLPRKTFPVPGCLIGVIFAFHSAFLDWDRLEDMAARGPVSVIGEPQYNKHHKAILHMVAPAPWSGYLSTSLLWHCLAYSVEHLALGHTFSSSDMKESNGFSQYLILAVFVFVMSSYLEASRSYRVVLVGGLALIQLSLLMVNLSFKNTYGLEIMLGITLVCITDPL